MCRKMVTIKSPFKLRSFSKTPLKPVKRITSPNSVFANPIYKDLVCVGDKSRISALLDTDKPVALKPFKINAGMSNIAAAIWEI